MGPMAQYKAGDTGLKPNALTSGIKLDRAVLKQLGERNDADGLKWLATWAVFLIVTGGALYWTLYAASSPLWVIPATIAFGSVLALPGYALSHECAHATAFRTKWLNETCYWVASLIYFEPPHHRRIAHGRHHSHTWVEGLDAQITFHSPMKFWGWLQEISGIGQLIYSIGLVLRNAVGRPDAYQRRYCKPEDLSRIRRESWLFAAILLGLAVVAIAGQNWIVTFILLPRLVGGVAMGYFVVLQHAEAERNTPDIRESTRSVSTTWLGRFLYMNMSYHVEHHLYPSIPFHALPALSDALAGQLPEPDPGTLRTNWELLKLVVRRSLGRPSRSAVIRQAAGLKPAE